VNYSKADMARELKSSVLPWLRQQGFSGSFPHFRRLGGEHRADLLTFQFDRHGGGYVIEIAQCPLEGIVTPWGMAIPASKAKAWNVHPTRRRRIRAEDKPGTEGWFRFDAYPPKQVAALTLEKLLDETIWTNLGPIAAPNELHLPR
jgi:Domain of unknown function (DUF4304)